MKAKKCDRCGNFYEPYGTDKQACEICVRNNDSPCRCKCDKNYDICPECMKQFERWLNNED